MNVILSADPTSTGAAARDWCMDHLPPGDTVIAVYAVTGVREFAFRVPPFDVLADEHALRAELDRRFGDPLRRAELRYDARIVVDSPERAVRRTADQERADLIVIGKHPHPAIVDVVLHETAEHLVHAPPCPVLVVPAGGRTTPA